MKSSELYFFSRNRTLEPGSSRALIEQDQAKGQCYTPRDKRSQPPIHYGKPAQNRASKKYCCYHKRKETIRQIDGAISEGVADVAFPSPEYSPQNCFLPKLVGRLAQIDHAQGVIEHEISIQFDKGQEIQESSSIKPEQQESAD